MNLICINIKPMPGNDVAPPLELNGAYQTMDAVSSTTGLTITKEGVYKCGCGELHYNVGLTTNEYNEAGPDPDRFKINFVRCYKCAEILPMSKAEENKLPVWWCHSSRFENVLA